MVIGRHAIDAYSFGSGVARADADAGSRGASGERGGDRPLDGDRAAAALSWGGLFFVVCLLSGALGLLRGRGAEADARGAPGAGSAGGARRAAKWDDSPDRAVRAVALLETRERG